MDAVALLLIAGILGTWPSSAFAHAGALHAFEVDPFDATVVLLMASSLALYATGVARLWRKAGAGRGVSKMECTAFIAGWLALAGALLSPLDTLGAHYFSAHMVQHELLMAVAAPLLVVGRPLEAWTWGLEPAARHAFAQAFRTPWFAHAWRLLNSLVCAWAFHAAALWIWHAPALFNAAVRDQGLHVVQHASFFGSAVLFWSVMLNGGVQGRSHPACLVGLFTTMAHSGALGALLTFAPSVWYEAYAVSYAGRWLTPLEDQQLGGLIMWVPGTLAYLAAGLWVGRRLLTPRRLPQTA